jgi:tRNA threonylcarbamoyladenosine biosynthesis protein TsaB
MYLIIDTSTKHGAVGIWRKGALTRQLSWLSDHNHTAELMPAIESLLSQEGFAPKDIQGIAVTSGPGGFGALRAGMSAAKGLAFALGVPLVGISSLEASAYPYRDLGYPVCSLLVAGRDLVAWARFQQTGSGWLRRTPDRVTPEAVLLQATGRHTLFCGEGLATYAQRLREALGRRAHLAPQMAPMDRLQGAAAIGSARLDAGEADPLAALQPHYLRLPAITPPRPPQPVRHGTVARR